MADGPRVDGEGVQMATGTPSQPSDPTRPGQPVGDRHSRSTAGQVALGSVGVACVFVLLAVPALSGPRRAVGTVVLVSAEALLLYVGYEAVTGALGPTTRDLLERR